MSFGTGIGIEQLWFERAGDDLLVALVGTSDTLTIDGWYETGADRIENFSTADGYVLASSNVEDLVDAMEALDMPEQTTPSPELLAVLQPVLTQSWEIPA